MTSIAILGHGVVGRGVEQIVDTRDLDVEVRRILDLPQFCDGPRMTSNYQDILDDPQIEVVVECMGGLEPARTYILAALEAGKSVVTSNKAVVAAYFDEFVAAANASGAALMVEATCGGGIPWIAGIEKAARIDAIDRFQGILNGTTNYIIDQMVKGGLEFDVALAQAQQLGYAERDPSADIDGIDIANKTIITASIAFGCACTRELPVWGIRTLTKADLDVLAAKGLSVKVLGRGVSRDGRYAVAVSPVAIPARSLEACVPDNYNLATLHGETIGELKFYGQGAGSLPTGNAMVQDVLDLKAGRHPSYDFSAGLEYDPALLVCDYALRSAYVPADADGELAPGYAILRGLDPVAARAVLDEALAADPSSFMVALPEVC